MLPYFNTAGTCIPGEHYMLPPERRLGLVMRLIDERRYFTLHAGRQTGKSTSAQWLADHYNGSGRYCALWVDIQVAREQPDPTRAFTTVLGALDTALEMYLPELGRPERESLLRDPATAVLGWLRQLARAAPRPLVVMFDEADGLVGEAMVSFLTQLRSGYLGRSKAPFPHSVVLIGMRQVRDYVVSAEERRAVCWLGTSSPFNVSVHAFSQPARQAAASASAPGGPARSVLLYVRSRAEDVSRDRGRLGEPSLLARKCRERVPFNISAEAATLAPFTREEVAELLGQHTALTGQRFEPEAAQLIYELSQGHPWLVNALAHQIVGRDVEDRAVAATAEHVRAAKETIVVERRSHIDSLIARLRDERVRKIVEPMLVGGRVSRDVLHDDFTYVAGLGLIVLRLGIWEIANPVYREVVVRELTFVEQTQLRHETAWYVRPDGHLDLPKLMAAFQAFWRKDGHLAAEGFGYREAGPHLMLMAFLQRIVNTGGRIEREYGLGRGALDLMVFWQDERHAIEIKLRRDTETEAEGVEQLSRYLETAGLAEGWLVLFDLRQGVPWDEKLYRRELETGGRRLQVVGC